MAAPPLRALIADFIESLSVEKGYSKNTCRAYTRDLEGFVDHLAGPGADTGLDAVDTLAIRGYLGALHKKNSKSTIARKLSALRSFFGHLDRRGLIGENPAEAVLTPRQE